MSIEINSYLSPLPLSLPLSPSILPLSLSPPSPSLPLSSPSFSFPSLPLSLPPSLQSNMTVSPLADESHHDTSGKVPHETVTTPPKVHVTPAEQESTLHTGADQNGSTLFEGVPVAPPRTKRKKKFKNASLEDLTEVRSMHTCIHAPQGL